MITLRVMLSLIMIIVSLLAIVANWYIYIEGVLKLRDHHVSIVPLAGVLGALGTLIAPYLEWKYSLLIILIDPGCLIVCIMISYAFLDQKRNL